MRIRPRSLRPGWPWRSRLIPLLVAWPILGGWSFLDPFHAKVEEGNRAAEQAEDTTALESYGEAAVVEPSSPIPDFNRGLVLSKGEDSEAARDAFLAASATDDPVVASDALYNLGNLHFDGEEWEPAIDSYLKSLDLDPDDEDARRNLELAVQRLEEQQQQQEQQEQDQEQGEENEEQDEEQSQPQNQDEEQPPEGQDESPPEEQEPEEESPPSEATPEEKMSREDAERLLNAIETEELKVLEQLKPDEDLRGGVTNDW